MLIVWIPSIIHLTSGLYSLTQKSVHNTLHIDDIQRRPVTLTSVIQCSRTARPINGPVGRYKKAILISTIEIEGYTIKTSGNNDIGGI